MPHTILIIEDDARINEMLSLLLRRSGYRTISAFSGTEGVLAHSEEVDLILLDLMLPGMRGEEAIGKLKAKKDVPVIVLSAIPDTGKKVDLFSLGADDYMTKPFDNEELLARIGARLRSSRAGDAPSPEAQELSYHGLTLQPLRAQVFVDGSPVKLTRTELAILRLLMLHPEQVVPKLTILERISEDTPDCTEDSLKIHVHNIRRKLKTVTDREYIESVWGIGFMLKS